MLQQIFDNAYIGLRSQGFKQSIDSTNYPECAYRGVNGLRCAIGWSINDADYDPEMEGGALSVALGFSCQPPAGRELNTRLQRLQLIHDRSETPAEMRLNLIDFAEACQLDTVVIDDLQAQIVPIDLREFQCKESLAGVLT